MSKNKKPLELPSIEELEAELSRKKHRQTQRHLLRDALYALITVSAATALIVVFLLPVFKTLGSSMSPTLEDDEIVVAVKTSSAKPGDVIVFDLNGKAIIKRVIALGGSVVDMDEEGNISVDGVPVEEPYVMEKAYGNGDVEFPFTVPENTYFVLGDNRAVSADSRNSILGCVEPEKIEGRVIFRVWPLNRLGAVR